MDIETLIDRAKAKEPQALETLYKMYFPKMMGVCVKIIKTDNDIARDLVHDAFILAFASIRSLRSPERFGEWMTTIVRNVALKYLGRKERENIISLCTLSQDNEQLADHTSADSIVNRQDIIDIIDLLPYGYGRVFRLAVIEGYSHKEIADMLGIEPHSSSSQLSRAKAMLRRMMQSRFLAVILVFILAIPTYWFFFYEKSASPELAKNRGVKKIKGTAPRPEHAKRQDANEASERQQTVTSTADHNNNEIDKVIVADSIHIVDIERQYTQTTETAEDSVVLQPDLPGNFLTMSNESRKKRRWNLLAIGSAGPAVAQNIYKIFATKSNGGIEGEAPTIPEYIDTWEDYALYLHIKEHDGTPMDTMAMMEIATHNNGEIIEREHHDRPITFGISLNKALSDRWSIETGVQYSILKSKFTMGNDGYYVGKDQRLHYLGVPLRLSYRFIDYKRLSAYGTAGVSLNIPLYGKVESKYVVDGTSIYAEDWHITPPLQWSTGISVGVQYNVLPNISLYVEPTLYWHIPNGSSTHTIWTERPFMFSSPFGVRFTFK